MSTSHQDQSISKFQGAIYILLLAAIWGASFLFMRVLSAHLPSLLTANLRMLLAGVFLFVLYSSMHLHLFKDMQKHYRLLMVIGLFNSAIPFSLYAFAAHHIPVAYSAILNALTPIFTALVAGVYLKTPFKLRVYLGLILGILGVYILMYPKLQAHDFSLSVQENQYFMLSLAACVGATICYAVGANITKKHAQALPAPLLSTGSQLIVALLMLPISTTYATIPNPHFYQNMHVVLALLALGILCSGIAYTLFFKLLKSGGPVYASITTFLIPLFGIFWAYVFLGEAMPSTVYFSAAVILSATFLVLH
jgi:drug/metabolite transporter (DMT)-like permease